jgi:lipoyl(octanoyl) transferase
VGRVLGRVVVVRRDRRSAAHSIRVMSADVPVARVPDVVDLGRLGYGPALAEQRRVHELVVASRESAAPMVGMILLVEHDPVITVTARPGVAEHVLLTREMLAARGIEVHETDRGGDVTYHGPGQIVVYPILDLNALGLGLHAYMRLLEEAVIRTVAECGLRAEREEGATGVWIPAPNKASPTSPGGAAQAAKIAAMGVRLRKWVSMHGLSLNVAPDMSHFGVIVPCGLVGRPVTSLKVELGEAAPTMAAAKRLLTGHLLSLIAAAREKKEPEERSSGPLES